MTAFCYRKSAHAHILLTHLETTKILQKLYTHNFHTYTTHKHSILKLNPTIVNSNIMKIAFKNAENDVKNHVSIHLGGHLFLRASEVCSIETMDIILDEVEFDYSSSFNVKRFMIYD